VIPHWLPDPVLNGSRQRHWASLRKQALVAQRRTWEFATAAGWKRQTGKVKLTVTLVFDVRRRRDTDNLYARAKHCVDGLKGSFFEDDDTEHLELHVLAEHGPVRETRFVMEPA